MDNDEDFYKEMFKTQPINIQSQDNKESNKGKKKKIHNKKKKKQRVLKRIILIVVSLIIVLAIGIGGYIFSILGGFNQGDLPNASKPKNEGLVNILLIGKDMGDLEAQSDESLKRTDTIILVNLNTETMKINAVSIPRDTKVEDLNGNYTKINSLYQSGVDVLSEEIEELLMVDVNYVVEVDYKAFREFIDEIGGVTVTPEEDMHYVDVQQDLYIDFKAGETVNLDGQLAENYFRWRQNNDGYLGGFEDGDIGRINHQQKFLMEIFDKCISPEIIGKIPDIVKIMQSNITTNMDASTIRKYALMVPKVKKENINMFTLNGVFDDILNPDGTVAVSYWKVVPDQNAELYAALNPNFDPYELKKGAMKVIVLNGTGKPGLASSVRDNLKDMGYGYIDVSNIEGYEQSVIQTTDATIQKGLINDTKISKHEPALLEDYVGYDAIIILGNDYKEGSSE